MKNISKRLLALAIALVMVIGMIPAVASVVSAAGEAENFRAHEHYTNKSHEGWTAWEGDITPADADWAANQEYKFYLTGNTTLKHWVDLRQGQNVTICLCGHKLTDDGSNSGRMFRIAGGATVTIVDCTATGNATTDTYTAGMIVPTKTGDGTVAGLYAGDVEPYKSNSGNFYMYDGIMQGKANAKVMIYAYAKSNVGIYGGKMIGNANPSGNGGAIYAKGTSASTKSNVTVSDTLISGCSASRGSAICVDDHTNLTIENSTITDNTCLSNSYAAVTARASTATMTIKGSTKICDNINTHSSATYQKIGVGLQSHASGCNPSFVDLTADAEIVYWSSAKAADVTENGEATSFLSVTGNLNPGQITVYATPNGASTLFERGIVYLNNGTPTFCLHEGDECDICGMGKTSAVAQIGTTTYASVEEAVAAATAGQTVTLLTNATAGDLNLDGITLDLNGKNLVANSVAAMNGKITDSSENGTGLLKVAQDKITLAAANALAVWNGADGFHFTDVTWKVKALKNDNGTYKVRFIPVTSATVAELLKDGGSDNLFAVKLNVTWDAGSKAFSYNDTLIGQLYTGNNGVASTDYVFTFTFKGVENFSGLKVTAYVAGGGNTVDTCGYEWEVV